MLTLFCDYLLIHWLFQCYTYVCLFYDRTVSFILLFAFRGINALYYLLYVCMRILLLIEDQVIFLIYCIWFMQASYCWLRTRSYFLFIAYSNDILFNCIQLWVYSLFVYSVDTKFIGIQIYFVTCSILFYILLHARHVFGTVFSDGGRPERVNHLELNTALGIPYKRVYSSVATFCGFQIKRIERQRWSYTGSSIAWLCHLLTLGYFCYFVKMSEPNSILWDWLRSPFLFLTYVYWHSYLILFYDDDDDGDEIFIHIIMCWLSHIVIIEMY